MLLLPFIEEEMGPDGNTNSLESTASDWSRQGLKPRLLNRPLSISRKRQDRDRNTFHINDKRRGRTHITGSQWKPYSTH